MERVALIGLGFVGKLYSILPDQLRKPGVMALAGALWLLRFRRSVIIGNLRIAFPSEARLEARVWSAYEHFARLVFEILMIFGSREAPMRAFALRQHLVGLEHWEKANQKGKGVIFLSSHVGNWEVMAAVGAAKHGMDLMLVTKHLKPEWLHQAIERGRLSCSVKATYEPRTLNDVMRHLRSKGTVGFVMDQYAGPPVGIRVPFLGVCVGTPTIVGILARRTGAAIVPVVNYRDAKGNFLVVISPEIELPPAPVDGSTLGSDTALLAAQIEKDVRQYPTQWLWTHRRFKGDLSPIRAGEWEEGRPRKS